MKILIATCSTGEGHNGAARAIAEKLGELNVPYEICDPLDFKSKRAARRASAVYARTIKYAPALFGAIYELGRLYDSFPLATPVYCANASYADEFYGYIKRGGFDCVVCTHLFAMQAITAVNRKFGCRIPCYGVLTDYVAIPFYKETDLDGYFVTHEEVRRQLVEKGVPRSKIHCSGIPVSGAIHTLGGRREARTRLGIPQDKAVISVLSGGAGCGKIVRLCKKLLNKFGNRAEIYAFPAKNARLYGRLNKKFGACENVKIIPFTCDLPLYIASSDVVLSKAGGLSSTEIAAAGVPLVHVKSIHGCETANRRYFAENGASVYCPTAGGAAEQVAKLLSDPAAAEEMRANQRRLIDAFAVDSIVQTVLSGEAGGTVVRFGAEQITADGELYEAEAAGGVMI